MKTLDKSKPFGTVHGDDEGRCYFQNDRYYDVEGELCATPEAKAKAEAKADPEAKVKAK